MVHGMRMHCLCKAISSSGNSSGVPISSNVYLACRAMGIPKLCCPRQGASFLHTSPDRTPLLYKNSEVFCFTELNPSYSRLGLHPFFTNKITHHCFTSTRGLQSAPKRTALRKPSPNPISSPTSKKGKVHAGKDSQAKAKSAPKPVQAQKKSAPKQKQAETKSPLKPVQSKAKSSPTPVQAKAASSSKQALKKVVVDEQEDSEEDEDIDDDDEDFDDDDDDGEDFDDDLIDDAGADDDGMPCFIYFCSSSSSC